VLRTNININTIEYRRNEKLILTTNPIIDRITQKNVINRNSTAIRLQWSVYIIIKFVTRNAK
jgi:hypothetical protein